MPLPPLYDEHGDVRPPAHEDEQYLDFAGRLVEAHAGGWSPDSIPGKQALAEFEAFVRETQARAVEAFVRWWDTRSVMSDLPWYVESLADEYAEHVREGRVDLSGNRVVS
jgi:hypothetical protein